MDKTEKTINEVKWLQNILIPKILDNGKLIPNYNNKEDTFLLEDIIVNFIDTDEAFMLTNCYKAQITYLYNGVCYTKNLLTKKTPKIPQYIYEAINFDSLFRNEIYTYTKIIPEYLKIEENILNKCEKTEGNGPKKNCPTPFSYSEYFYSDITNSEAVIVLGDFNTNGWRMTKSRVNLSLEHILVAVKHIGKFHGIGFGLKQTDRKKFDSLVESLQESRYKSAPNVDYQTIIDTGIERIFAASKTLPQIPEKFIDDLRKMITNYWSFAKNLVQPIEPIATICHGDFLRNNVAYKYSEESNFEIPTDILLFDWQTLRYSSPMIDLSIFLTISSGKDVRQPNFKDIFQLYMESISSTYLTVTNTKKNEMPEFLSEKIMLHEYIRFLPYSLAIAGTFLHTQFEPMKQTNEDFINNPMSAEEIRNMGLTAGGETVDRELAALILDLYELVCQENVNLFNN